MEWFKELFNQVSNLFKWWVIVLPWERGIRVRMGKKTKELTAGIYFRIPYLDSVYVQPVRLTFVNFSPQTLTMKSGETITLALIVGYKIKNISQLYNSVSAVEGAVSGTVMGNVAKFVTEHTDAECSPQGIADNAKDQLQNLNWGIEVVDVTVVSYAKTKTYRLIQDQNWMGNGHTLETKR